VKHGTPVGHDQSKLILFTERRLMRLTIINGKIFGDAMLKYVHGAYLRSGLHNSWFTFLHGCIWNRHLTCVMTSLGLQIRAFIHSHYLREFSEPRADDRSVYVMSVDWSCDLFCTMGSVRGISWNGKVTLHDLILTLIASDTNVISTTINSHKRRSPCIL
jgi:hypothetical protein